jgi:hypothetical protein
MAHISIFLEDCPECGSDNLRTWHSHYCQAFFVICNNCRHEDGRESTERQAVAVWNRAAQAIEARRAATLGAVEDESAGGATDAPQSSIATNAGGGL